MPDTPLNSETVIVGGGLVGMATALSLAKREISSVLLESQVIAEDHEDLFDDRTLVINPASKQFWQTLGIWSAIKPFATVINQVHVSNQGKFGVVQFDKDDLQVPQLGYVVAAKKLANILLKSVKNETQITYLQPATLVDFVAQQKSIQLTFKEGDQQQQIKAQLMVGADGVQSPIRSQLNLATAVKSYQRSAIVCNVITSTKHQNRAYERLTKYGPVAMLPFRNRYGFVWSMPTSDAEHLLQVTDQQFLHQAQQQFGYRAGEFMQIGRRSSYPIYQIHVPRQHAHRVVLMGNAAHAVSPVSAQGLNLAVRGINRLSEQLQQAKSAGLDLGTESVLSTYQKKSAEDQQRTLNYTDDLMTWFKIDEPLVNTMRSIGMVAINASVQLKQSLFKTAGGLR